MAVYKNDADLQGLWLLEEVSGNRADSSQNSNTLTDTNTVGSSADCQEGVRSADFERGAGEYLVIVDGSQTGLDPGGPFSVGCWFKPESIDITHSVITKYDTTDDERAYQLTIDTDEAVNCLVSGGDGSTYTRAKSPTAAIAAGTWYHLVAVYDGTDIRVYIDGALASNGADNPATYSGGVHDSTAAFILGSRQASANHADGLMDEAFFFDRALTSTEVNDIYTNGIQDPVSTAALPVISGEGVHSLVFGGVTVR